MIYHHHCHCHCHNLSFPQCAGPQGVSLYVELNLAVIALALGQILETLNAKNVPKVNSVLRLAARTRPEHNLLVCEDQICHLWRDQVDQWQAQ